MIETYNKPGVLSFTGISEYKKWSAKIRFVPDNSKNKVDMADSVLDEVTSRKDISEHSTMKAEELKSREVEELWTLERRSVRRPTPMSSWLRLPRV